MKINVKHPLFVLAAGVILVGASAFGTTKAVNEYSSETQGVTFETAKFSVDLIENQSGNAVSVAGSDTEPGKLALTSFSDVVSGKAEIQVNQKYSEEVFVKNTSEGDFPEYVRVTVVKDWVDADGEKITDADPTLIQLMTSEGWLEVDSTNGEEAVFYYTKPLAKGQQAKLLDGIQLEEGVLDGYRIERVDPDDEDGQKLVTIIGYQDKNFEIQVRVDAVQARHAKEAMLGAWGVDATIATDGTISGIN